MRSSVQVWCVDRELTNPAGENPRRGDAGRSGTSAITACRQHQRLRRQLPAAERRVTVPDITMAGRDAHATVRGANGYPVGVTLARDGAAWRLTAFSTSV